MATSAKRPCTWSGCPALVSGAGGRCEKHPYTADQHRRQAERNRGTAHERGYTSAWQKARAAFLAKHPLCAECERNSVVAAASVVDHIVPHKGDKVLFWDRSNWQSMCKTCHDRKTATEDGGWGRPFEARTGGGSKV